MYVPEEGRYLNHPLLPQGLGGHTDMIVNLAVLKQKFRSLDLHLIKRRSKDYFYTMYNEKYFQNDNFLV